jgi:flagellar hook protein FlgE
MKNHQTRMDVIGNNIANVNTTGYKSSRVQFKDVLGQTIAGGQVASGVTIAGINKNFTQGSQTATENSTDLYIHGNGFFGVQDPNNTDITYYTRDGSFSVDEEGNLVNSLGYNVCDSGGSPITGLTPPIDSISIDATGEIFLNGSDTNLKIGLATVMDLQKLSNQGNNLYKYTGTEDPEFHEPGSDNVGTVISNNLEMSNVDLTDEFSNMIVTQRGYQANSKVITTSDEMLQELIGLKR